MTTEPPLVLAITGASGALYALALLRTLLGLGRTVHMTMSPSAVEVFRAEVGRAPSLDAFRAEDLLDEPGPGKLVYHDHRNFSAGIASGSFLTAGMVVVPCSMSTLGSIAHGITTNLITRAADVHLKERRKLILVPRETPLSLVHLENMVQVTRAGAIVLPAAPAWYHRPKGLEDMVAFVVGRICDQLGVANRLIPRWGEGEGAD
ncbi:UbiX family flavin prenyltransferase [Paludisphaera soli]|uniref:UbiX family flavin prenyltransferase n=1 Tax=Paludisphaera soli TaxID=2712865 RepID=UPI0013ED092A|nr:flavin prenyltransferase UbiX [Paludisphaera soli]